MKLSSTPKPVNFRIVLNNVEITSIELLQQHFDFERHLVTDQPQFISWIKRVDKTRGEQIEDILNRPADDISYVADIISILNIIYEPKQAFNNLVDFVNFLYVNNENNRYEVVKSNFSNYISNHVKLLRKWFPIDMIPQDNNNLSDFFSSLNETLEKAIYLSQLYYRQGNLENSKKAYPPLWKLDDRERKAIQAISSGGQPNTIKDIITSDSLSIVGTEFIFLCVIAYVSIHRKDNHCKALSELIDEGSAFKLLRDRIGGSLKKLINKKNHDFYKMFSELGYTSPDVQDPLFNEKLFLSSLFTNEGSNLISSLEYYPANYILKPVDCLSNTFTNSKEAKYIWLNHILKYHDSPIGLEGDFYKHSNRESSDFREEVIIAHQFKYAPSFMAKNFCKPKDLNSKGNRKIKLLQWAESKGWNDTVPMNEKEKEYFNFFKTILALCNHPNDYFYLSSGRFSFKAQSLFEEYKNDKSILSKEKLFVMAILLLIKDANKNTITTKYVKIRELRKSYVPLMSLFDYEYFKYSYPTLSDNDKIILKWTPNENLLDTKWRFQSIEMERFVRLRIEYFERILRRWIANFVYYTD